MSRVENAVRNVLLGFGDRSSPGLIAVSGGPDSVALLLAAKAVGATQFTVVHVNHKLRGDDSDGDESFVRELAEKHNVPFRSISLPIPEGESIETTARNLRYGWFQNQVLELGCQWVATAHTADDQTETVLHRIIRGTGLPGLSGIKVFTRLPSDVFLVRPFLEVNVRRKELIHYLEDRRQPYRIDSSNSDTRFTRNRIRHEILPALRKVNPQVDDAILRLSQRGLDFEQFIFNEVAKLQSHAFLPNAGDITVVDIDVLSQSASLIRGEFFRRIWTENRWPQGEMSESHWQRLAELQTGDYPGGISVRRVGKVVQLWRKP